MLLPHQEDCLSHPGGGLAEEGAGGGNMAGAPQHLGKRQPRGERGCWPRQPMPTHPDTVRSDAQDPSEFPFSPPFLNYQKPTFAKNVVFIIL